MKGEFVKCSDTHCMCEGPPFVVKNGCSRDYCCQTSSSKVLKYSVVIIEHFGASQAPPVSSLNAKLGQPRPDSSSVLNYTYLVLLDNSRLLVLLVEF